ncbi:hypothetical protein ABZP36_031509 [Zizania latifolia]
MLIMDLFVQLLQLQLSIRLFHHGSKQMDALKPAPSQTCKFRTKRGSNRISGDERRWLGTQYYKAIDGPYQLEVQNYLKNLTNAAALSRGWLT